MGTAISAKNTKGLRVYNSHFVGSFDPVIDLENAEDAILANNKFSDSGLNIMLSTLAHEISHSELANEDKKELFTEIINHLSYGNKSKTHEKSLKSRILKYVGDKAVDCFVQLVGLVGATKI